MFTLCPPQALLKANSTSYNEKTPELTDTILDLFCITNPSLVKAINTIPGISDHDGIILVDMYIKPQINKKPRRVVHIWSKANWDSIKEDTRTFYSSFLEDALNRSLEENWGYIVNYFTTMRSKYIPSKLSSSRYNVSWLSGELRRLCRKKNALLQKS